MQLDAKIPEGPIQDKWDSHKFNVKLVNPANKRKYEILVIGTGLAGASAAATLGELGYNVTVITYHDSPRRAHSIAAQGGINATKNYHGDGDSIFRLFYDTVKGGDYRSREPNVYRLAQVSSDIIDQCTAQGIPFAREYGGLLDNRSFGGAQVSRTFYARGQTGQQLLLGAYQALARQIKLGKVKLHARTEMLEVVLHEGRAVGVITRDLVTGEIRSHSAHAVVLATGGYANAYFLSTMAMASNATAAWRAHRKGALFANASFTQIHPTAIPQSDDTQSKLTLMSESLRNDGRIWVPKKADESRPPGQIPPEDRDYYLERKYPAFGNLVPRDVASRNAMTVVEEGRGVGPRKNGVYLDFAESIGRLGKAVIEERYGNLFEMYERITDENPYEVPMRIYPAPHYTMGGLWVDYNLMTTIPGLYSIGEANFSDHGANRLGASALMQGTGRRLLRPALHDQRLPGAAARDAAGTNGSPGLRRSDAGGQRSGRPAPVGQRQPHRRLVPPRTGQDPGEACRDVTQRAGSAEGPPRNPCPAGGISQRRASAGRKRIVQPIAGEGRPGRRLLRAGRADGARCAQPAGIVRRAFPRGEPDTRRRSPP